MRQAQQREKGDWEKPTYYACYTPSLHLRRTAPKRVHLGWLCLSGLLGSVRIFVLGFLWFYVNFHLRSPKNRVYLILHRK